MRTAKTLLARYDASIERMQKAQRKLDAEQAKFRELVEGLNDAERDVLGGELGEVLPTSGCGIDGLINDVLA